MTNFAEAPKYLSHDEYGSNQDQRDIELNAEVIGRLSTPARQIVDYFTYLRGSSPLFPVRQRESETKFGTQLDESIGSSEHPLTLFLGQVSMSRGHIDGEMVYLDFFDNHPSHFTKEPNPKFPKPVWGLKKLGSLQVFHSEGKTHVEPELLVEKALKPARYEHALFLRLVHEFFEMHGPDYQRKIEEYERRIEHRRSTGRKAQDVPLSHPDSIDPL